jgi:hypothetical protein
MGLDCEFIVVDPEQYAKRRLWQWFTIEGTTAGHGEAGGVFSQYTAGDLGIRTRHQAG